MSGSVNYDGIAMTKQYLFGTTDVPDDFNERVRDADAPQTSITYSADQYLTSGPGRFAWPSRANIVDNFFGNSNYEELPSGSYSLQELQAAMQASPGYTGGNDGIYMPIENYGTDTSSADYEERAYLFGGAGANLIDAQFHIAADGTRTVSDIVVQPRPDNFDFGSDTVQWINNNIEPLIDPYGLGQKVNIEFDNTTITLFQGANVYTYSMYLADEQKEDDVKPALIGVGLNTVGLLTYANSYLWSDPILAHRETGFFGVEKEVVYLSADDEDQTLSTNVSDLILVGNKATNYFSIQSEQGVEVYASGGDDEVYLLSAGGHYIDGHHGQDTASYSLSPDSPSNLTFSRP